MALIPRYPEGSDLTLLNVSYHRPHKNEETGKWSRDFVDILYKDNTTGRKYNETIYEPTYIFYKAKEGVNITHNMFYISRDKVNAIECKYNELEKTIAELTGNTEFFYDNCRSGNRKANKALHTIPTIFSSDAHIEDHIRARFAQQYKNSIIPISKGYFDIEVDTIHMKDDFPAMGECPVNAISFIDDKSGTVNVFLLRDINGENPLIAEFEENFSDERKASALFKELREFVIENVGGQEKAEKFNLDKLEFRFAFYDQEDLMLIDFFKTVNTLSPDFLMAWNMPFDVPYLYARCYALGMDPNLVMSKSNREERYAYYVMDMEHKNVYELRGDYYDIACDTVYMDQLVQFASRRKGQSAFPNFKLDTAANIITKGAVRKLDYSHITTSLTYLPYKDYKTFVFYNIMDTVAQKCIEESVKDIDYIFSTCLMNDTRYAKGHRQTVYLTNRVRKSFYADGYILGNNCNTGESTTFAGALVGDPTHNSDYSKLKIDDQVYNISDNCDDFDFKSLYPSIIREHNLASNNIVGKISIDDQVSKYENPYHQEMYDRGGQFIEDLVTGNSLEFGKRWLNLGGIKELLEDMEEYFSNIELPSRPVTIYTPNGIKPFAMYPNAKANYIKPFIILQQNELIKPFITNTFDPDKVNNQLI